MHCPSFLPSPAFVQVQEVVSEGLMGCHSTGIVQLKEAFRKSAVMPKSMVLLKALLLQISENMKLRSVSVSISTSLRGMERTCCCALEQADARQA
jgi:hypothetical protein